MQSSRMASEERDVADAASASTSDDASAYDYLRDVIVFFEKQVQSFILTSHLKKLKRTEFELVQN